MACQFLSTSFWSGSSERIPLSCRTHQRPREATSTKQSQKEPCSKGREPFSWFQQHGTIVEVILTLMIFNILWESQARIHVVSGWKQPSFEGMGRCGCCEVSPLQLPCSRNRFGTCNTHPFPKPNKQSQVTEMNSIEVLGCLRCVCMWHGSLPLDSGKFLRRGSICHPENTVAALEKHPRTLLRKGPHHASSARHSGWSPKIAAKSNA